MCFVLSWYIGLLEIYFVVLLSQNKCTSSFKFTHKSLNKPKIQVISQVVDTIVLYPASIDDLNITLYLCLPR